MARTILALLIAVLLPVLPALAQEGAPAGYVAEFDLTGEDAAARTAIIRNGEELPPKLMMPVFAGDVVFLRDPDSRMVIELGNNEVVTLGSNLMRHGIAGEIDTGDGAWGIIAAIGGIMAGEDEPAPENMVSRGGALKMPMARREGNFLLQGRRGLWLGWQGGKAPFNVALLIDGNEILLAQDLAEAMAEITLPEKMPGRFSLVIRDSEQQKVQARFRFGDAVPQGPAGGNTTLRMLANAAWLSGQADGAWTVEAAQLLRASKAPAAAVLLRRIQAGWKLDPPAP